MKELLQGAEIDSGNIRVGVVTYSTTVHEQFQLNTFTTKREIYDAIDQIPYTYGSTNTADGLAKMSDDMFVFANGDRPTVPNVAILITDGISNVNSRKTIPNAKSARARGIHIYVVGVGLTDAREINAIASVPASQNVFQVTKFDELKGLEQKVFGSFCEGQNQYYLCMQKITL